MIVIYVELWPGGDQSKARPIGSMGIASVTEPGDLLDNYVVEVDEAPNPTLNIEQLQTKVRVQGHNRNQSVWKLIRRAIDGVFPPIVT